MSIGIQSKVLGRLQQFYAMFEPTPCVWVAPTGADALKVLSSTMSINTERVNRTDARQTRSMQERITRGTAVSWALSRYLLPSGVAGTPPDDHQLLFAATGAYANTPATSDVYTLSAAQALRTLTLLRHFPDDAGGMWQESVRGAWVEETKLSFTEGDEPKVEHSGGAVQHAHTGPSTLDGALAGGEAAIDVDDPDNFEPNSYIAVGSSTAHQVTAKAGATLTITPVIVGAQGDGLPVIPYAPAEVTAGAATAGIQGLLDLGALTGLSIISAEVTLKNNIAERREAFNGLVVDATPGYRDVTGTITVRARRDQMILLGRRKTFTAQNLLIRNRATAGGTRVSLLMPAIEMMFGDINIPEAEEADFQIPFQALQSATPEDELTITFD